jgi:hypothetical protein
MTQVLQIGERVSVKKGFRTKPDSYAYQQGLKSVSPNLVGEVAGQAPDSRELIVSFKSIPVFVKKQNLVRAHKRINRQPVVESTASKETEPEISPPTHFSVLEERYGQGQEAEQYFMAVERILEPEGTLDQPPVEAQSRIVPWTHPKSARQIDTQSLVPPPRKATDSPQTQRAEQRSVETEAAESGLLLLTLIANKVLLKGNVKIRLETAVEISLGDLPAEMQKQLQSLIDAKLSLDLRSLWKRQTV